MADRKLNEFFFTKHKNGHDVDLGSLIRWRIKTIRAKKHLIMKTYPARVDYTQSRKTRSKATRKAQKKLNDRNRAEQFKLLLLTNFSEKDQFVTLTFEVEPADKSKALEKLKYFLKKLRKTVSREIKYLGVVEMQDTDGDPVRCHIHLVISGVDHTALKKSWIYGKVKIQKIKDTMDAAGYLCKAFSQMLSGEHHYVRSRNLKNPDVETKTLDVRYLPDAEELDAIIKCPKEYAAVFFPDYEFVKEPEIWHSSFMPGCYVRMELVRGDSVAAQKKVENYRLHQANEMLGYAKSGNKEGTNHRFSGGSG